MNPGSDVLSAWILQIWNMLIITNCRRVWTYNVCNVNSHLFCSAIHTNKSWNPKHEVDNKIKRKVNSIHWYLVNFDITERAIIKRIKNYVFSSSSRKRLDDRVITMSIINMVLFRKDYISWSTFDVRFRMEPTQLFLRYPFPHYSIMTKKSTFNVRGLSPLKLRKRKSTLIQTEAIARMCF